MDLDETKVAINFRSLLQRLMVELVAEENKLHENKVESAVNEANTAREAAKAEREKRKLEALERSKQRQANPEYFAQRSSANAEAAARKAEKEKRDAELEVVSADEEEEEGGGGSANVHDDDPFRSYVSKSKNKIFVR